MKIKGQATLSKFTALPDGSRGELIQSFSAENIINKRVIQELFVGITSGANTDGVFDSDLKIATSTNNASEDHEVITLSNINAVGDPTLVGTPYVFTDRDDPNPAQLVYTNQFNPPASTRTINKIGIVQGATLVDDPGATTVRNSYTELLLGVSTTQENTEILVISYKIFIDWTGTALDSTIAYQRKVEWRLFDRDTLTVNALDQTNFAPSISWFPGSFSYYPYRGSQPQAFRRFGYNVTGIGFTYDNPPLTNNNAMYEDEDYGRYRMEYGRTGGDDLLTNHLLGLPTRGFLFGDPRPGAFDNEYYTTGLNSQPPVYNAGAPGYINDWGGQVLWNKTNNLSTLWSHNETATAWMYDVAQLANSSWQPTVTENSVVPDFHTSYYLRVTQAGGLGIGQYKLYKDGFMDYYNNDTATQPLSPAMWTIGAESPYNVDPTDETILWNYRWVYPWAKAQNSFQYVSFRRSAGVALWELTSETHDPINEFPVSVFTQFGSTINDVDVYPAGDLIYVATENGLYEITGASGGSPVVNQLNADACASVAVGLSGKTYAIFRDGVGSGRLSSDTNWAVAEDVTGSSITWDNVWRIWIDPTSADNDLMIYEGPCPKHDIFPDTTTLPVNNLYKIHWWDNVSKWISTDQFGNITDGIAASTDHTSQELTAIPSNFSVQITNGVWMYPRDMFEPGGITENLNSNDWERLLGEFTTEGGGAPFDLLLDLKGSANNRIIAASNTGWNVSDGSLDLGLYHPWGMSKNYAWGFHAAAPFHNENLDGSPGELVLTKPSPGATTYTLAWFQGFHQYLSNQSTITGPSSQFRIPMKFKLAVDEGGTSVLTDYSSLSTTQHLARRSDLYFHLPNANIVVGDDQRRCFWFAPPCIYRRVYTDFGGEEPDLFQRYRTELHYFDGGIGQVRLLSNPTSGGDFDDVLVTAYEWDGVNWIIDEDNTGPGKPLHTGNEALVDGLFVSWTDLQPGNSQDFIVDQWYNIVKMTEPTSILAETTSPTISGQFDLYYRELVTGADSGTTPGTAPVSIILPEAPTGSAPDSLWLSLPPDNVGPQFSATINGSPVPIFIDTNTSPAPGTIHITDTAAGEVYFAAADSSQPYTISYFYIRKYHTSETL